MDAGAGRGSSVSSNKSGEGFVVDGQCGGGVDRDCLGEQGG